MTATVTTTYPYDLLNRVTSKSYSDTTPRANFFYDQFPSSWPAWTGVSTANAKGRLVLACTNSSAGTCTGPQTATAHSYDSMGRIQDFWQCTPYNCGNTSIWKTHYDYDLGGDVKDWTHPGGFTVTNSINTAQHVWAVSYSPSDSTHPSSLIPFL